MKRLLTVDQFMVALVSALSYGYVTTFTKLLGLPEPAALLIILVFGIVTESIVHKIVYSKKVQKKKTNRLIVYAVIILIFAAGHFASMRWLGVSMMDYVKEHFLYVIVIPIIGFVINLLIRRYHIYRIQKHYGDGSNGFIFDLEEKDVAEINQQNQRITGPYKADYAVRTRTGVYVGEQVKEAICYLGIPYAKPPVGDLRWKAPEPLPSSEAVFEASHLGASAIQVEHKGSILKNHRQSEDCLTLNIGVKELQADAKKPVLVLFHSGDFTFGGTADPLMYGSDFVNAHSDIVFVSFNYRLGIFGFIDFSEIPGGERYPDASNLGLLDQIAALRWIRENIAAFGGDPDRITVLGFDSGAISICLLSACEQAKGLFRKAFVFNGGPYSANVTPKLSRALAKDLLKATHTTTMEELQQLNTDKLKDAAQKLWLNMCAPTCDDTLIPADVYAAWRKGAASGIEFIIGIPAHEMQIIHSFVGNENYIKGVSLELEAAREDMDDATAHAVEAYLEAKTATSGELDAKSSLLEQWLALNVYFSAAQLSANGNPVHLLYWNEKPLIENLGSGSLAMAAALLGNGDALQMYGNITKADLSEVLQALLVKFIKGESLKLYHNEIPGVDALKWKAFPKGLIVSDGDIKCAAIADKITEIKSLLDFMMKNS